MKKKWIDEMMDDFYSRLEEECDKLKSITVTGSYSTGKISLSRPDINLMVFFEPRLTAETSLKLGEIFSDLMEKYSEHFALRAEFRPFRFTQPQIQKAEEVFLNPLFLNMADKDMEPFPFGIKDDILEGMKSMREVVYGEDVMDEVELTVNLKRVIMGESQILPIMNYHLWRAPLIYGREDVYSFFNESFMLGKLAMYDGVELALSEEELSDKVYVEYISEKEKLRGFYRERYGEGMEDVVDTLLKARSNYNEWKNDPSKAREIFKTSFKMLNVLKEKLEERKK